MTTTDGETRPVSSSSSSAAETDPTARAASLSDGVAAPRPGRGGVWLRGVLLLLFAGGVAALFLWQPETARGPQGPRGDDGRRPVAVAVAVVAVGTVVERATYPGELDADVADVGANVAGRLLRVDVRVGDGVTAGQTVAVVDDADLRRQRDVAAAEVEAAQAARRVATVRLASARREAERARALARDRLVSGQQADQLGADVETQEAELASAVARREQARAQVALLDERIAECTVVAPFAGTVAARLRDAGGYVQPGTALVRLVVDAPLRVRFDVPEADLAGLRPGVRVSVMAPPTGAAATDGRVTGVAAESDRSRRVVPVEGVVDAPPAGWLPGMFAQVVAVRRSFEGVPRLPAEAVLTRLGDDGAVQSGVLRAEDGVARWVPVDVLGREGTFVAVAGAVAPGDQVLVSGHSELGDGAPITIVGGTPAEVAPASADSGAGAAVLPAATPGAAPPGADTARQAQGGEASSAAGGRP